MARLPSGYTELEYIESTGTQHIDTGFTPNQNSRVSILFEASEIFSDNKALYGARASTSSKAFSLWLSAENEVNPQYGNVGFSTQTVTLNYAGKIQYDQNKNVFSVNEVTKTFSSATFSSGCTLLLFSVNTGGAADDRKPSGKLYSCQIYDNGEKTRDFVPCKNQSGDIGLYDIVSKTFYENSGSGAFIAGPEIVQASPTVFAKINGVWKPASGVYAKRSGQWRS